MRIALSLALSFLSWFLPAADASPKPNVVIILADDYGFRELTVVS
jgi:hypothetical protein